MLRYRGFSQGEIHVRQLLLECHDYVIVEVTLASLGIRHVKLHKDLWNQVMLWDTIDVVYDSISHKVYPLWPDRSAGNEDFQDDSNLGEPAAFSTCRAIELQFAWYCFFIAHGDNEVWLRGEQFRRDVIVFALLLQTLFAEDKDLPLTLVEVNRSCRLFTQISHFPQRNGRSGTCTLRDVRIPPANQNPIVRDRVDSWLSNEAAATVLSHCLSSEEISLFEIKMLLDARLLPKQIFESLHYINCVHNNVMKTDLTIISDNQLWRVIWDLMQCRSTDSFSAVSSVFIPHAHLIVQKHFLEPKLSDIFDQPHQLCNSQVGSCGIDVNIHVPSLVQPPGFRNDHLTCALDIFFMCLQMLAVHDLPLQFIKEVFRPSYHISTLMILRQIIQLCRPDSTGYSILRSPSMTSSKWYSG